MAAVPRKVRLRTAHRTAVGLLVANGLALQASGQAPPDAETHKAWMSATCTTCDDLHLEKR
jgi:hypothetical protein